MLRETFSTAFGRGMVQGAPGATYPRGACEKAFNWRVRKDESLELRAGLRRAHATAFDSGAQIRGIFYDDSVSPPALWVATQTKVFKMGCPSAGDTFSVDGLGTPSTIASSLSGVRWTFRRFGDKLLIWTDLHLYKYESSNWSEPSIPIQPWWMEVFNDRVWAYDPNVSGAGVRIYGSAIGDETNWAVPDGLVIPLRSQDPSRPRAFWPYGTVMLVYQRHSISTVDGYGNTDVVVSTGPRGLTRSVGLISSTSIGQIGDEVFWLSERGVESLRDGEVALISGPIQRTMDQIDVAAVLLGTSRPWAATSSKQYRLAVALGAGATQNTHTLIFDTRTRSWVVDRNGDPDNSQNDYDPAVLAHGQCGDLGSRFLVGGYDGFIRVAGWGDTDDELLDGTAGSDIPGFFIDAPSQFTRPMHQKRARVFEVSLDMPSEADVDLALMADAVEGATHTITVPETGDEETTSVRARVSGRGRTVQGVVRASTPGIRIVGTRTVADVLRKVP